MRWPAALLALLIAGCAPAPVRTPPPPLLPAALAAEQAADPAALVFVERNAAAARDLSTLAGLWAEDATLLELRGSGDADDYRWAGRAAILDRYVTAVFPVPPAPLQEPLAAQAEIAGNRATLRNGVDRWRFEWLDGRWWITALEIGTP